MNTAKALHIVILGEERSIHARRWTLGLRNRGHRVDLVTLRKDPLNDIGGISLDAGKKLFYANKIWRLRKIINELRPDILHAHQAASYGFLASFVNHPRKVLSIWGDDIVVFPTKNFLYGMIFRYSLKNAKRITCTSGFLKNKVISYGYEPEQIAVIPFGIDLDKFVIPQRPIDRPIRLGIAKGFIAKYGIDYLLRAFQQVVDSGRNAELTLAGRGDQEDEYKQLAISLGLKRRTAFLGLLQHDKIPEFLAGIDIFVMPSISDGESFGVAALEASASGLPVVASRVGGVPEVVIDGVTGILVDRCNSDQLAVAINKLIDDPGLRIQMGQAGRDFVEKNYRWEKNVEAMENLYLEMMN
jgi:glycosyltransferase involved in cell wall biosynthesis